MIKEKKWGYEKWLVNNELYCMKELHLNKGHKCSYHHHKIKDETFIIRSGKVEITVEGETTILEAGFSIRIYPLEKHCFKGIEDSLIYEVSTQHFEEDSYRETESE